METRANYVAVGAFVLTCVIGLVVGVLWLAGVQYNQEYSYYQAHFKGAVTGLGTGTVTRYNGIDVGRITALKFDPADPQSVIVTLQVQPDLNIREDSVASIDSQGLTGGSFVEINGGAANSPVLSAKPGQRYPVIRTKQSTLAQLEQSAPELVGRMNVAVARINDLLDDSNRHAISDVLVNLDIATATIARRSSDIDAIIRNTNEATENLRDVSRSLPPMLGHVDQTVQKVGVVADDADAFLNGDGVAQIPDLISELRLLVANLNKFSEQLNRSPTTLLFGDRRKGYSPK
jgi:phospholipid/cholesterol/gamma-HCH transport system substrate-binding protein